jgi:hypothetical protein
MVKEIHLFYGGIDDLLLAKEIGETKTVSRGLYGDNVGQDHFLLAVLYNIGVGLTHLECPPSYKNNRGTGVLSTQMI